MRLNLNVSLLLLGRDALRSGIVRIRAPRTGFEALQRLIHRIVQRRAPNGRLVELFGRRQDMLRCDEACALLDLLELKPLFQCSCASEKTLTL